MNLAFLPTDTQSCSAVYPRMCSKVPFLSAFKLGIVQVYKDTMMNTAMVHQCAIMLVIWIWSANANAESRNVALFDLLGI